MDEVLRALGVGIDYVSNVEEKEALLLQKAKNMAFDVDDRMVSKPLRQAYAAPHACKAAYACTYLEPPSNTAIQQRSHAPHTTHETLYES